MKNNAIKYIDYLFVFIVIVDLGFSVFIAISILPQLSDYHEGWSLIGITSQIVLYFILGIAVIVTFITHHRAGKWILLAFAAIIYLSNQMIWTPNTEYARSKFNQMYSEIQNQDSNDNIGISKQDTSLSMKVYIRTHPHWTFKIIYIVGLIYAFLIRPRYIVKAV